MNLSRLTISDIEKKIERIQERIVSLNNTIKQLKDPGAKEILRDHIHKYNDNLAELKEELSNRKSNFSTNLS